MACPGELTGELFAVAAKIYGRRGGRHAQMNAVETHYRLNVILISWNESKDQI